MILKFIRMIFVAFISIFNISLYSENQNNVENTIVNIDTYAVNTIKIEDVTNTKSKVVTPIENTSKTTMSSNTSNNKIINSNTNETNSKTSSAETKETVSQKAEETSSNKILTTEKTSTTLEEFTGKLTGYGPDCLGCSGKGNLACKTRENKTFSLVKDGIYYTDTEYGKVRILSAATSKFKCGTIIEVSKDGATPFTAIVLDTGGDMIKAWNNGTVWMDLAYSSSAMSGSDNLTGTNIKFSVQRWGW
jgi:hypothetical protein